MVISGVMFLQVENKYVLSFNWLIVHFLGLLSPMGARWKGRHFGKANVTQIPHWKKPPHGMPGYMSMISSPILFVKEVILSPSAFKVN